MYTFEDIVRIKSLCGPRCSFYSVRLPNQELTEFQRWIQYAQTLDDAMFKQQFNDIIAAMQDMRDRTGARLKLFRHEDSAHALPTPATKHDLPCLRLYCLRLTNEVVILFNGSLKTTIKAGDDKNESKSHFQNANRWAKEIDDGMRDRELATLHLNLLSPDGTVIIRNE